MIMKITQQILRLIRQGESETLEFKESFGKDVIESICAFSNSHGGTILIGVSDKGEVKVGRFRNETLIVDDRVIEGTLFDQVDGTMGYFREKLDTMFVMTGKPARDVVWEYPLEALREAVTNAICHRDYLSGSQTQVRIYDKELMVMNPGGLPVGISKSLRRYDSLFKWGIYTLKFYTTLFHSQVQPA